MSWTPRRHLRAKVTVSNCHRRTSRRRRSVWISRRTRSRCGCCREMPSHKRITRMRLLGFLAAQTRCVVTWKCAGAHHRACEDRGKLASYALDRACLPQDVHQARRIMPPMQSQAVDAAWRRHAIDAESEQGDPSGERRNVNCFCACAPYRCSLRAISVSGSD